MERLITAVSPAPWHVDPVSVEDDEKLRAIQDVLSELWGGPVAKTQVLRLAVRRMYAEVVEGGGL